jgi:hypothetical protein
MLIRKRQYRNSQASIVEVGNRDEFPDFADLLFHLATSIKNKFSDLPPQSDTHL